MLLDHDISNCSRRCAVSGRAFAPGETYFSELVFEHGATLRRDVAATDWRGPTEAAIAWWRSRMTESDGAKAKLAPQDVLLNLFSELAERTEEAEFRYLLGLLLIRRKLLKVEHTRRNGRGETLVLDCPSRGEQFELQVAVPTTERADKLQQRLVELLYGGE